ERVEHGRPGGVHERPEPRGVERAREGDRRTRVQRGLDRAPGVPVKEGCHRENHVVRLEAERLDEVTAADPGRAVREENALRIPCRSGGVEEGRRVTRTDAYVCPRIVPARD